MMTQRNTDMIQGHENVSSPTMMLRCPQSQAVNSLGQFGAGTLDDTLR